jgi:hypothetical protein
MSYNEIVERLTTQDYQVTSEVRVDDSVIINIMLGDVVVGFITFMISEQSTGEKRPTKYRVEDAEEEVCNIHFIEVTNDFQSKKFGYYLMLLAALYTKEHFPNITKATLDDCSDRSGDVVGNLYFKTGMTPTVPQKLLVSGEVQNSVPLTNKRGSMHITPICGPERVGELEDIINASIRKINSGGKGKRSTNKRRTNRRKRTNKTKTNKRRTNKRRTNKRRTNKRRTNKTRR